MKITTADCKQYIVDWCAAHTLQVEKEITPLNRASSAEVLNVKNWKRDYKQRSGDQVERKFDCAPYDDQHGTPQIVAYVYTDADDQKIVGFKFTSTSSMNRFLRQSLMY
jgi:hypothetical protein